MRRLFSWVSLQAILGLLLLVGIDYVFFIFSFAHPFFRKDQNAATFITLELLADGLLFYIFCQAYMRLQNLGKGLDGENKVLAELKKLPKDHYHFLMDFVDGKRGNTDFVVVGD